MLDNIVKIYYVEFYSIFVI